MIVVDVHTHTAYSHGKDSLAHMWAAAQRKGLEMYGFSEHSPRPETYDYPVEYRDTLIAAYPRYIAEVQALQRAEQSKGEQGKVVLLGIELDWFEREQAFMQEVRTAYTYDYAIGGIHFLGRWGFDFSADDWKFLPPEQCFAQYQAYFETFVRMVQSGLFNVAAHPDIIKIFSVDIFRQWLRQPLAKAQVREALAQLKAAGMAMEISSAGLRKPCAEIYPGPEIMALAAELQVPISFASDAHCVNTVAYAFDELARYARSFGYTHSQWFRQGQRHEQAF